jgi:hypothetical protein
MGGSLQEDVAYSIGYCVVIGSIIRRSGWLSIFSNGNRQDEYWGQRCLSENRVLTITPFVSTDQGLRSPFPLCVSHLLHCAERQECCLASHEDAYMVSQRTDRMSLIDKLRSVRGKSATTPEEYPVGCLAVNHDLIMLLIRSSFVTVPFTRRKM